MNTIRIILYILCIGLILSLVSIKRAESVDEIVLTPELTIKEMIAEIAPKFGQEAWLISKISYCESWHKIKSHDGGRAKNVTGIHDKTFKGWLPLYEKEQGETLDIYSSYDQLKMMSWAFSKGESYRRQWTTYRAYQNGGTYTFYSNLLKGWFTSKCK